MYTYIYIYKQNIACVLTQCLAIIKLCTHTHRKYSCGPPRPAFSCFSPLRHPERGKTRLVVLAQTKELICEHTDIYIYIYTCVHNIYIYIHVCICGMCKCTTPGWGWGTIINNCLHWTPNRQPMFTALL